MLERLSRSSRAGRRGATLIEALVATVVITVGTAAITELLKYVSEASRRMAFQSSALDVYGEITAYIEDARCNIITSGGPPQYDALLAPLINGPPNGDWVWLSRSPAGRLVPSVPPPQGPLYSGVAQATAPVWVAIRRVGPDPPLNGASPPGYTFEIQVRERTFEAARDNPARTDGYWIRVLPAKKVCTFRDDAQGRGEL